MKIPKIEFRNARFTIFSNYSVKIEYSPSGKFIDRDLFITLPNNLTPVDFKHFTKKDKITIETSHLKIFYKDSNKGFRGDTLKIYYKFNDAYKKWSYGKKDKKNLKGPTLDLMKYPEIRGKYLPDGVLSKKGYFVYEDNSFFFWNKDKDWADFIYPDGYKILFFIGYGADFKLGLLEYSKIFGETPMIPIWAFGYWYSRWYPYHQNDFVKIVKRYRASKIPIDVMVVDTDWRKNVWNGYDWSDKYFPEPEKFIKEMKRLNIHITLNDHPGYNSSEPVPKDDSHIKFLTRGKKEWRCNWLNKEDVRIFCEKLLIPKLKEGIDFWWVDGWGADGLPAIESFLKSKEDKMELGVDAYKRLNPQLWLNHFYYETTKKFNRNKRALILSRFGGVGAHRYPVWFTGDTYSNWQTLAYEVYYTYTAGNLLCNFVSHDLGGFLGENLPKDLYIRWIQFGAFSPIMRTHSSKELREPFHYDDETVEIFRKYVRLRYRLLPYFNKLNFESYKYAMPIARSLYYEYPEDKNSYKNKYRYQYLLGDSILVAPVVSKNSKKVIYFPLGEWLAIETGEVVKGPKSKKLFVPLSIIPIFIKRGSVIPVYSIDKLEYIRPDFSKYTQFEIFPNYGEKIFEYYEDDGFTENYKKGEFFIIPMKFSFDKLEIGEPNKFYKPGKFSIVFHYDKGTRIKEILVNGKPIKFNKTKLLFNEIQSPFESYKVEFCYKSKPVEIRIIFSNL